MAKGFKPVSGSRAYWPRKRAKRIYPRAGSVLQSDENAVLHFAGYKAGMSQIITTDTREGPATSGKDMVLAVTVLDCPPMVVAGAKAYGPDDRGIKSIGVAWAEKLSKDLARKCKLPKERRLKVEDLEKMEPTEVRLIVHTRPRESGFGKKKPEMFELSLGGDVKSQLGFAKEKMGSEIRVSDFVKPGEYLDVSAVNKGKGFQGPVVRFGIKLRGRKDTQKKRHVGVMGDRGTGRVRPGKIAMAGQHGFHTRTEYNKQVVKVASAADDDPTPKGGFLDYGRVKGDYILLKGSIPGPKKRLVILRKGIRSRPGAAIEVRKALTHSHQGA